MSSQRWGCLHGTYSLSPLPPEWPDLAYDRHRCTAEATPHSGKGPGFSGCCLVQVPLNTCEKSTALISRCKILLGFHGSPFSASIPCSRFTLSTSGGIRAVFLRGIPRCFPCSHDSWGRSMTQVSLFRIFTAKMFAEEFL